MSNDKGASSIPTPQHVATAIYQVACSRGISSSAEIADQAGQLLAGFAIEHPEHPIAWFFDQADDLEVEEFFRALGDRLSVDRPASSMLADPFRASIVTQVDVRVWLN
jgi:hypothetical protein